MKKKLSFIPLLMALCMLASCNKKIITSSNCSASVPTISTVTPTPTPETINPFDYAVFSTRNDSNLDLVKGTLALNDFSSSLTEEMREKIEEVVIPDEIDGKKITYIYNNQIFKGFTNLKKIHISKNIVYIGSNGALLSSPFCYLPNLEEISVDKDNDLFYVKGNCLIRKEWNGINNQIVLTGNNYVLCGWKDVEIPNEIIYINNFNFANNESITSIKLNPNLTNLGIYSFRYLNNLNNIDLNGNTNFKINEGENILYSGQNIYAAWGKCKIPDSITSIATTNNNSLEYTNIEYVDLNKVTTIGDNCFRYTKLKRIYLPETVTSVVRTSFAYLKNLEEIIVSNSNTTYYTMNNILFKTSNDLIICGWKDVVLPESTSILPGNAFSYNLSITSLTLTKNVQQITHYISSDLRSSRFYDINYGRKLKDFFKLYVVEDNPYFKYENNILYQVNSNSSLTYLTSFPDESGTIIIPAMLKTITENNRLYAIINGDSNPSEVKRVVIEEGIEEISTSGPFFTKEVLADEIVLPSTLNKIARRDSTGGCFLTYIGGLKKISFNGKNENEKYYIKGNCLIEKGGNIDGTDKLYYAWEDVVIPEEITVLSSTPFNCSYSVKSLTLHNKFTDIIDISPSSSIFANLASSCTTLIYKGTVNQFKSNIGNYISFYDQLKKNEYRLSKFYFLDNDGNQLGPYTWNEVKSL